MGGSLVSVEFGSGFSSTSLIGEEVLSGSWDSESNVMDRYQRKMILVSVLIAKILLSKITYVKHESSY